MFEFHLRNRNTNLFHDSVKSKLAAAAKRKPRPSVEAAGVAQPVGEAQPAGVAQPVDPPAPSDEPPRRYPRRNLPPTNYAALESPNDDDFICKL